jgi:hypothetical protein
LGRHLNVSVFLRRHLDIHRLDIRYNRLLLNENLWATTQ